MNLQFARCQRCGTELTRGSYKGWGIMPCRKCGNENEVVGDGASFRVTLLGPRPKGSAGQRVIASRAL